MIDFEIPGSEKSIPVYETPLYFVIMNTCVHLRQLSQTVARVIIKIPLTIVETTIYVVLEHLLRPFVARGDIFASLCGPRAHFSSKCGP